jgi:putative transposase
MPAATLKTQRPVAVVAVGGKAQRIPPSALGQTEIMPQYIRTFVPGGTFFFTVMRLERRRQLLTDPINDLRFGFKAARQRRPFTIEAMVIWPDHLHCRWTLPAGDAYCSTRRHDIKMRFAAQILRGERLSRGA